MSGLTLSAPAGVSGLPSYNGYVYDEWLPELQGYRGRRLLREMQDNDSLVSGVLLAIEMLGRQVGWRIAPGENAPESDPRVAFIEECRSDMTVSWEDAVSEIFSFLPYGFSFHETLFKRRDGVGSQHNDGRIGWHSWPMRAQESLQRWEFGPLGEVLGFHQLGPPDWTPHFIPIEKALLFRTSTKRGNPEGKSILRGAYRSWYFRRHLETIEAIGAERNLAGLPIGKIPLEYLADDATPEQQAVRQSVFDIVVNIRRDEQMGVLWPLEYDDQGNELWKLETLSSGSGQTDTDKIITRHTQAMAIAMMADFILLGHENVGSNALSQDKTELFGTALGAWLDGICAEINARAIPQLLRLNGMPTDNAPVLEHGDIERPDLESLGMFLKNLALAGFEMDTTFHGDLLKHLLGEAHLPEPPTDIPPSLHESTYTGNEPTEAAPAPPPAEPAPEPTPPQKPAGRTRRLAPRKATV